VAALSVVGALSAIGATSFFRSLVDEQEQLQRNMLRTEALIESTGRAAGFTAGQLHEQARAMADATLANTEDVMRAQQVMLTFGTVTGDAFTQAISLSHDLAAVMGGDAVSSARQLGRALEDPANSLTVLGRTVPAFRGQLGDTIRQMAEMGDVAGAQAMILQTLAETYGGIASREAEGLAGAQDTLSKAVQESRIALADYFNLGERASSFYNVLSDGANRFSQALTSGNLDGRIRLTADALQLLAGIAAGRVVASLGAATGAKLTAVAAAVRYQASLVTLTGASGTAAAGQLALAGATRTAAAALALVGGPAGAAVIAAGAMYIYRDRLTQTGRAAREARVDVDELTGSINRNSEASINSALVDLRNRLREVKEEAAEASRELDQARLTMTESAAQDARGAGQAFNVAQSQAEVYRSEIATLEGDLARVREGADDTREGSDEASDALGRLGSAADDLAAKFRPMMDEDVQGVLDRAGPGATVGEDGQLRDAFGNTLPTLQRELEEALKEQVNAFQSEQNLMAGLEGLSDGLVEGMDEAIKQRFSTVQAMSQEEVAQMMGVMPTNEQNSVPELYTQAERAATALSMVAESAALVAGGGDAGLSSSRASEEYGDAPPIEQAVQNLERMYLVSESMDQHLGGIREALTGNRTPITLTINSPDGGGTANAEVDDNFVKMLSDALSGVSAGVSG
jgi:hypothetical protein